MNEQSAELNQARRLGLAVRAEASAHAAALGHLPPPDSEAATDLAEIWRDLFDAMYRDGAISEPWPVASVLMETAELPESLRRWTGVGEQEYLDALLGTLATALLAVGVEDAAGVAARSILGAPHSP